MRSSSEVDVFFRDEGVYLACPGGRRRLSYAEHEAWIVGGRALEEVFEGAAGLEEPASVSADSEAPSLPLAVGEHLLLRPLGRGSFGEAFEGWDPVCGERVAIKMLHRVDAWSLQAFKNEFRRLAAFSAVDGLVVPDELIEVRGRSALVMRLVGGREIDLALREAAGESGPLADEERLRALTVELVRALVGLHSGGLIHMDLKPGNVRVEDDGGVCLLDFGLSRLRRRGGPETHFAGSPLYIAPEQLLRQPPTGAVDLYALGVILYVALVGAHPFEGAHDTMIARLEERAPPLERRRPGAGPLWAKIVAGLLEDRPANRLGAEELLALLGVRSSKGPTTTTLVGRDEELDALRRRWRRVCGGMPSLVVLSGEPGVGKTELARGFGDALASGQERAALVWTSCYESEAVPYKTVDALVEGLVELLLGDPDRCARARELPGLRRLARVAPALEAILGDAPGASDEASGSRGEGLASLVSLVAERAPLLLAIDDAQWGDADSADLLAPLLTSPSLREVMIVLTVRSREWGSAPFGRAVESQIAKGLPCELHRREVTRLGPEQARVLLRTHAPEARDEEAIETVIRLADGSPYLLAAYAPLLCAEGGLDVVRSGDVIGTRLAGLSEGERRLIDTIAVAGAPIDLAAVIDASGGAAPSRQLLRTLGGARVLALDHRGGRRRVTIAHGLIREGLLARIEPEERRRLHSDVAGALLSRGAQEPGRIAQHLLRAGRREEARALGLEGAAEAERTGAYAQLADLLGLVLEAGRGERRQRERLVRRRAKALAAAGRGREAGNIYVALAESASDPLDVRALKRAAVEAWMSVGEVARGLDLLRPMLAELRVPRPRGGVWALARLVRKLGLLLLSLRTREVRLSPRFDAQAAERADACWVGIKGLSVVEPVVALNLMIDGLGYAAASGSPLRLGRAMGLLVAFLGTTPGLARHVPRWLAMIEEWSTHEPYLAANLPLWRSFQAHSRGELSLARREGLQALELLGTIQEASWERVQAASCAVRAMRNQGEYVALESLCRAQLRRAERSRDPYGQTLFRLAGILSVLARGGIREARVGLGWISDTWLPDRYTVQTFYVMVESCYGDLYDGDLDSAAERLIRGRWPYIRSGGELIPFSRVDWRIVQGRVGLAFGGTSRRGLMPVTKVIAQLRAAKTPEAIGSAELMSAALAAQRGARDEAVAGLDRARGAFDQVGIRMSSEVARLRRAQLLGDNEEIAGALREIQRLGAAEPERWAQVLAPGFPRTPREPREA